MFKADIYVQGRIFCYSLMSFQINTYNYVPNSKGKFCFFHIFDLSYKLKKRSLVRLSVFFSLNCRQCSTLFIEDAVLYNYKMLTD